MKLLFNKSVTKWEARVIAMQRKKIERECVCVCEATQRERERALKAEIDKTYICHKHMPQRKVRIEPKAS